MAAFFALPSAVGFGLADFTGGLAARRAPATLVTAASQLAGVLVLLPMLVLLPGQPSAGAALFGAGAGLAGGIGLVCYLHALAIGPMGLVAPLSGLSAAGLPLLVGVLAGEDFGPRSVIAIGLAGVAIGLAGGSVQGDRSSRAGLYYGFGSGAGFGLFFVLLDAAPGGSGAWPLLAARVASIGLMATLLLGGAVRRATVPAVPAGAAGSAGARRAGRPRGLGRPWLIAVSGSLDMAANVLFLLAARTGSLGTSAVLVSLYPVVVTLMARVVLRERLNLAQVLSVGLALAAAALLGWRA